MSSIRVVKASTPSIRVTPSSTTIAVYHTGVIATGGSPGITDHGNLAGRDDDDHQQYALADGSRGAFAQPHSHPYEASGAVSDHASGSDVHSISGVNGLQSALNSKISGIVVQDENSNVATDVVQVDFQGNASVATSGSGEVVVTVTGIQQGSGTGLSTSGRRIFIGPTSGGTPAAPETDDIWITW